MSENATPRPCARYFGSDGTLCATHNGRFLSDTTMRCDGSTAPMTRPNDTPLTAAICGHDAGYGTRCGLLKGHQTANHYYLAGWEVSRLEAASKPGLDEALRALDLDTDRDRELVRLTLDAARLAGTTEPERNPR